jgi:hypothetical protein
MLDAEMLKKVVLHSVATALASIVLPVPGGPYSSTPFHGDSSPWKSDGYLIGMTTASLSRRFASSLDATSAHRTSGDAFSTSRWICAPSSRSSALPPKSGSGLSSRLSQKLLGSSSPAPGRAPPTRKRCACSALLAPSSIRLCVTVRPSPFTSPFSPSRRPPPPLDFDPAGRAPAGGLPTALCELARRTAGLAPPPGALLGLCESLPFAGVESASVFSCREEDSEGFLRGPVVRCRFGSFACSDAGRESPAPTLRVSFGFRWKRIS